MDGRVKQSSEATVLYEVVGNHIALVTINRPEARNAINPAVASELGAILHKIESDDSIWVVVLTGAGDRAFCAGADLKAVSEGLLDQLFTPEGGFAGFVFAPRKKLWIGAINGFALAGGLEISLACDLLVASEKAVFGLPEVKRGLIALAGGVLRLPRALPRVIALEMIASGEPIDAVRAYELGLVNRVVPAERCVDEALALAIKICGNAPIAVRESLYIARQTFDLSEPELIDLCVEAGRRIVQTQDYLEGPRAFVEKRSPRWVGE